MSPNATPAAVAPQATPVAPRASYEPPTLEALGSWSALTMQGTGGIGGFIDNPIISRIVGHVR